MISTRTASARVRASSLLPPPAARLAAFLLTFGLLSVVQLVVDRPMLMAERFVPGTGWIEAGLLAMYAAWMLGTIYDPQATAVWRRRIWTLFSVVFFGQLLLGLAGMEQFLMSGKLHLPVPGMIVAGPLYRGEGVFMPILFLSTVALVGPAWCSYLCYVGSWDLNASVARKRPLQLPRSQHGIRLGILAGIAAVALGLRALGVPGLTATLVGATFGLVGVAIMATASRRMGTMVHCAMYCPIGLVANVLGRLSPFRLRIQSAGCSECSACSIKCRYGALRKEDIEARRPGLSCTLCGDCVTSCKGGFIHYAFLGLKPETARTLFLVMVISIHAVFLGVARI